MDRVAFADVEPTGFDGVTRRGLTEPLGATNLAMNRYRIPPDEGLPGGLHAHMDQEEIFFVTEGTMTFETFDGLVTVAQDEAIRFAPGEFQSGHNRGSEPAQVIAIGAPRESSDVRLPVDCPACDHDDLRMDFESDGLAFVCPACAAVHVPAPCPHCGCEDLRVGLGDDRETVVRCEGCDGRFDRPPLLE